MNNTPPPQLIAAYACGRPIKKLKDPSYGRQRTDLGEIDAADSFGRPSMGGQTDIVGEGLRWFWFLGTLKHDRK